MTSLSPLLFPCIGGVEEYLQFLSHSHLPSPHKSKISQLTISDVHCLQFRVKFWNVAYLEEMDYDKTKKPLVLPKSMVRSKSKKLAAAREVEHQLPSSGRANKAEFFQGLKPE